MSNKKAFDFKKTKEFFARIGKKISDSNSKLRVFIQDSFNSFVNDCEKNIKNIESGIKKLKKKLDELKAWIQDQLDKTPSSTSKTNSKKTSSSSSLPNSNNKNLPSISNYEESQSVPEIVKITKKWMNQFITKENLEKIIKSIEDKEKPEAKKKVLEDFVDGMPIDDFKKQEIKEEYLISYINEHPLDKGRGNIIEVLGQLAKKMYDVLFMKWAPDRDISSSCEVFIALNESKEKCKEIIEKCKNTPTTPTNSIIISVENTKLQKDFDKNNKKLKEEFEKKFEEIEKKQEEVETNGKKQDEEIKKLKEEFTEISNGITEMYNRTTEMYNRTTETSNRITEASNRITEMRNGINNRMEDMWKQIEELAGKVGCRIENNLLIPLEEDVSQNINIENDEGDCESSFEIDEPDDVITITEITNTQYSSQESSQNLNSQSSSGNLNKDASDDNKAKDDSKSNISNITPTTTTKIENLNTPLNFFSIKNVKTGSTSPVNDNSIITTDSSAFLQNPLSPLSTVLT